MDELIHHCLRELSFDGDLGCDVSRLRDFIIGFHSHDTSSYPQVVDDAYYGFVWSIIVHQPTVRIGTVPPGECMEVYLAPQISAKRKAKERGEVHEEPPPATNLDIVPDAKLRTLADLNEAYGDTLRIAVDPETSFAAITGSHIRPSKLSPMVYTALQLVTRGREDGISVLELGKKSKYDQKTCHYLVNQLLDLDLVVKIRRGGVGSHFCIHKYFFERSPLWKQIRDEEAKGKQDAVDVEQSQTIGEGEEAEETQSAATTLLRFDPIDARHLSSLPLVRARVVKLLRNSTNYMHASQNMLIKIGFAHPTKTDRRFFQTRINDLISQGLIEKLYVPQRTKDQKKKSWIQCLRLITPDGVGSSSVTGAVTQRPENTAEMADHGEDPTVDDEENGVKYNRSLHKQMIDLLEDAGTTGLTLNELSDALGHLDKRTIELLMTRLDKYPPPAHLSDLGIAELMETHGRERRHRYYTVTSYRTLVVQESLHDSTSRYAEADFSSVGEFLPMDQNHFYEDPNSLVQYQDNFKAGQKSNGAKPKAKKTKKNSKEQDDQEPLDDPPANPVTKGKEKSKKRKRVEEDTEMDPEFVEGSSRGVMSKGAKKRKIEEVPESSDSKGDGALVHLAAPPKKRGRPPKKQTAADDDAPKEPPRKRGRPKKVVEAAELVLQDPPTPIVPKKRGRPPKNKDDVDPVDDSPERASSPKRRGRPPERGSAHLGILVASPSEALHENSETKSPAALTQPCVDQVDSTQARSSFQSPIISQELPFALEMDAEAPLPPETEVTMEDVFGTGSPLSDLSSQPTTFDFPFHPIESPQPSDFPTMSDAAPSRSTQSPTAQEGSFLPDSAIPAVREGPQPPPEGLPSRLGSPAPTPIDPVLLQEEGSPTDALKKATQHPQSETVAHGVLIDEPRQNLDGGSNMISQRQAKPKHPDLQATSSRPKVNVSHLRRENEILRLLQDLGGIALTSTKDFVEAHVGLIDILTKAGEPTSAPIGSRLDKRTIDATLNALESRSQIKTLKTSVIMPTGSSRSARVAYLPTTPPDLLNSFLADLSKSCPPVQLSAVKKVDEELNYGGDRHMPRRALPLQLMQMETPGKGDGERWAKNTSRADELFTYDEDTIRDVLLTEKHTLAQMSGFIVGKVMRAQKLHLHLLKAFENLDASPRIVSHQERIIHFSYLHSDIPVSLYFAVVSALVYDDRLLALLETDEGKNTPVRELEEGLHSAFQIGRARSRSRFLDLFEIMRSLKLVTPLRSSDSTSPLLVCAANGDYPTAFEMASLEGWSTQTPVLAPVYWRFNSVAPLHLWVLSETCPPFYKDYQVAGHSDAAAYWQELRDVCLNDDYAQGLICPESDSLTGPLDVAAAMCKTLRRPISWNSTYVLSWHQSHYLKKFVDPATGDTPLEDGDGGASSFHRICWVACAPQDVVHKFFSKGRTKRLQELEKARRKAKREAAEEKAKRTSEAKALSAQKVMEAKVRRERDWDEMLKCVQPEELKGSAAIRVRRVRTRFINTGSSKDLRKWEDEIAQAIRDASLAAQKILSSADRRPSIRPISPAKPLRPVTVNPLEKSVESLIAQQGPPLQRLQSDKRTKKGRKSAREVDAPPTKPQRRNRFQWNKDYDELVRDASAIIKARCRKQRIDWGAFEQVFPSVPRNTVRQRLGTLREAPGGESYLQRLEDGWNDLWAQHRGTDMLPDDDPESPTNFDLIQHVEFLRRHIDKNALRVGFTRPQEQTPSLVLPSSIEVLSRDWEVEEKQPAAPLWDFMWNVTLEEGREKTMKRYAFTTIPEVMFTEGEPGSETVNVAEAAVKMVMGTPNEKYNLDCASKLLHHVGEQSVSVATSNLLGRSVLSKVVRDPRKAKPGRTLKISEMNQNLVGGLIPRDTFQDASALEDISTDQVDWREWPLLATDGDCAALLELTSDVKVEFRVDTSGAQNARGAIDWNSKKADDDDIETALFVRFRDMAIVTPESPKSQSATVVMASVETEPQKEGHGLTIEGLKATCRRAIHGPVDCKSCLEEEMSALAIDHAQLVPRIVQLLDTAGPSGLTFGDLLSEVGIPSRQNLLVIVGAMTDGICPLAFWAGYSTVVLVSSSYLRSWTVVVSEDPMTRVFPRRWLDIQGCKIRDIWDAALRAVMGVVLFRPGVLQVGVVRQYIRKLTHVDLV
ncbi:hypothetical protein JAAARDRAFT_352005 [Jaapia argillacea MUCL 33604]|uniref:Transcription factor tau subunit sfc3/Tfc3 C-terminal domain-containing protein n=1 Tax=Jaapia argillacea MUCL 33604 TaxID=933084 RepID=A0A067PU98_9AGAM|nr:hypothetical protein JAAARDRAFT_352005 [Jaapia argillacea MUCL 33604]